MAMPAIEDFDFIRTRLNELREESKKALSTTENATAQLCPQCTAAGTACTGACCD